MDNRKSVIRGIMMITQLGLAVMAPVFLCIFIGYFLDSRLGLNSMFWLLMLGFLAGGRNGWILARQVLRKNREEGEEGSHEDDGSSQAHRSGR